MKKSIMLLSVLSVLSAPASADDAFWPAEPNGMLVNGGSIDPATAAVHQAHHTNLRNGIIANGGCNADMLPVWVAQGCGNAVFANADGGDNGGGNGSSSSGSGTGGESSGSAR